MSRLGPDRVDSEEVSHLIRAFKKRWPKTAQMMEEAHRKLQRMEKPHKTKERGEEGRASERRE
jgi:hypothetical protein